MLGLSTVWMPENPNNNDDLFRNLTDVGLDFLDLHPRATLNEVREGIALLRSQGY